MGNQLCCQQTTTHQHKQEMHLTSLSPLNDDEQFKPNLSDQILYILDKQKPFHQEFYAQPDIKIKRYGQDVYEGPLDLIKRPTNIGKMYKQNGAFFVGNFSSGKAEGPCFYIMPDGSYFKGQMKQNIAQCEKGSYISKNLEYVGGFKNNEFHGKGSEKSRSQNFTFQGTYEKGRRASGIMQWGKKSNQYSYQGDLDEEGRFTGKGILIDPQGKYQGQFKAGIKHGSGTYHYNSKLRYEGSYINGQKQGEGIIYNNDNTIAYKGVFKNGMPHGKGIATAKNGTQFQSEWQEGIDKRLL